MSRELDNWLASQNRGGHKPPEITEFYRCWTQRYPHWWDTLYHHAPARRKNRDKLKNVMRGVEEDDGNWANHKKPHKYYW